MSTFFVYVAAFILIISVIVFVHELGHYLFGKAFGVKVEEFSIGFGKEIFGFNDMSGTRWKFCMIPAGGYVKFFGDEDAASSPDGELLKSLDDDSKAKSLYFKPVYQKMLVAAGGPIANFIFSIVVIFFFFYFIGKPFVDPIITSIKDSSPAEIAGLRIQDKILKMDGKNIRWFSDVIREVNLSTGSDINFGILRDGDVMYLTVKPDIVVKKDMLGNDVKVAELGIASSAIVRSNLSLMDAFLVSVEEVNNVALSTLRVLGQVISGKRDADVIGGPVRIAKYSGQSIERGILVLLWFMAILSINLGLVNLFPIPMLDGGHLVFYMIEAIKGNAVALKYQGYAVKAGFLLLIAIFIFATFNDIKLLLK